MTQDGKIWKDILKIFQLQSFSNLDQFGGDSHHATSLTWNRQEAEAVLRGAKLLDLVAGTDSLEHGMALGGAEQLVRAIYPSISIHICLCLTIVFICIHESGHGIPALDSIRLPS